MQITYGDRVLQWRCSQNNVFCALVKQQVHCGGQLTLTLHYDEVVPGNVLAPDNARKATLIYFSFWEFGDFLHCAGAWITAGLIRTSLVEKVEGGMTVVMRYFFASFLERFRNGLRITIGERQYHVTVRPGIWHLIADHAGHKLTFACKGAGGFKPCRKCGNLCSKRAGRELGLAVTDDICDICEHDYTKFEAITDREAFAVVDELEVQSHLLSAAALEKEETLYGWNHVPGGLMLDKELRQLVPPSSAEVDPMHTYFSNGICNSEISLFLKAARGFFQIEVLQTYAASWKCNVNNYDASTCFSTKLLAREGPYAGGASMTKACFTILAAFAQSVLSGIDDVVEALGKELTSIASLAEITRKIAHRKHLGPTQSRLDGLQDTQQKYMIAFVEAYGDKHVRPKHHEQFHVDGYLDCWVLERKHMVYKNNVASMKRLTDFEANVLPMLLQKESAIAAKLSESPVWENQVCRLGSSLAADLGLAADTKVCESATTLLK